MNAPTRLRSDDVDPAQSRSKPSPVWAIPGVGGSTPVTTEIGQIPAHLVRQGDRLRTYDGDFLPVLKIDAVIMDEEFYSLRSDARPVKIPARSLGSGLPFSDVEVSPAQGVLCPGDLDKRRERPARELSQTQAPFDPSLGHYAFYIFELCRPASIQCAGVWVRLGASTR